MNVRLRYPAQAHDYRFEDVESYLRRAGPLLDANGHRNRLVTVRINGATRPWWVDTSAAIVDLRPVYA